MQSTKTEYVMSKQPNPLMDLKEIPQQRIYIVPNLPLESESLRSSLGQAGSNGVPKKMPRGASFLLQAEWAWSPMNNRISNYHLSLDSSQKCWVLWVSYFNDTDLLWKWETSEDVLLCPRKSLNREEAALFLLREYWRSESEDYEVDQFHWLNLEGLLSVAQAKEIAREVWRENE
jgi:hypothetical protein